MLLGSVAVANDPQSKAAPVVETTAVTPGTFENDFKVLQINVGEKEPVSELYNRYKEEFFELNLSEVEFIEEESIEDLGFNTKEYLPDGFDPYTEIVDVHTINYMEEENHDLDFNTKSYLPEGFSPYEVYFGWNPIAYIEEEIELNLGLNSKYLLPEGFDPYADSIEMSSVNFIEEEDIDLGFDTIGYLPEGFDPYARAN